jgi:hypothetical protein
MTRLLQELGELHDDALLAQLHDLVRRDRRNQALLVAHLVEVDRRGLYLDRGFQSLYEYVSGGLGFSDSAAFRRIAAARLVGRFPILLERIASGAVHLTALLILAPHLDADNLERLVTAASGKTSAEIGELVAPLRSPKPARPRAVLRAIRVMPEAAGGAGASSGSSAAAGPGLFDTVGESGSNGEGEDAAAAGGVAAGGAVGETVAWAAAGGPAGAGSETGVESRGPAADAESAPVVAYQLSTVLSADTKRLLDRAAELLRRQVRTGDVDAVLNRALRLLVEATEARRFGKVRRPRGAKAAREATEPQGAHGAHESPSAKAAREATETRGAWAARGVDEERAVGASEEAKAPPPPPRTSPSRAIPAAVRRAVTERDGGRCTFVAANGRRCAARGDLEFHHRQPFAHGGPTTAENLALLCAAHHRQLSQRVFGPYLARDAARGAGGGGGGYGGDYATAGGRGPGGNELRGGLVVRDRYGGGGGDRGFGILRHAQHNSR